jgi:hypothetical protein
MEKNYRWVNWDNAWQSLFFVAAFVFVVFGTQFLWAEKTIDRYVLELNSSNEVKIVAEIDWCADNDFGILGVVNRDITMEDAIGYVNALNASLKTAE